MISLYNSTITVWLLFVSTSFSEILCVDYVPYIIDIVVGAIDFVHHVEKLLERYGGGD